MFEPCGPLLFLRVNGLFCPCIESEDDRNTRLAELFLKSVPIRWYRKIKTKEKKQVPIMLQEISSRLDCGNEKDAEKQEEAQVVDTVAPTYSHSSPSAYIGIDATLDVVDTINGPALYITSNEYEFIDDEEPNENAGEDANGDGAIKMSKLSVMTKKVLFTEIDIVAPAPADEWNALGLGSNCQHGVVVRSVQPDGAFPGSGKKLLIFEVIQGGLHSLVRDDAVRHLNTVISWDHARVAARIAKQQAGKEEDTKTAGETLPDEELEDKTYPTYSLMDKDEVTKKKSEEHKEKQSKAKVSKKAEVRKMEERQGVVIIH